MVRTTRLALGDEGFAEAWAAGQALRQDEDVAEAITASAVTPTRFP